MSTRKATFLELPAPLPELWMRVYVAVIAEMVSPANRTDATDAIADLAAEHANGAVRRANGGELPGIDEYEAPSRREFNEREAK